MIAQMWNVMPEKEKKNKNKFTLFGKVYDRNSLETQIWVATSVVECKTSHGFMLVPDFSLIWLSRIVVSLLLLKQADLIWSLKPDDILFSKWSTRSHHSQNRCNLWRHIFLLNREKQFYRSYSNSILILQRCLSH